MEPIAGRIVQYFTTEVAKQTNLQGEGPYAAIITYVFGEGSTEVAGITGTLCSLKVFPTFKESFDQGSVEIKEQAEKKGYTQYWTWPPRS